MPPFSLNYVKLDTPKSNNFPEKMTNPIVIKISTRKRYLGSQFRGNSVVTPWELRTTSVKQKICTFADDKKRGHLNPHITNNFNSLFNYGKT